ncbi:MAG: 5-bromo-4-chloroindolyl phosphate hydrolysis family protein [Selenomonadaceae bacterium]|nr:5-bromo-4-chloroindolyl phosphate hydrolysis family protein [Selenomonadaceae bacterium]
MDYLLVMLATVAMIFGGKAAWDWKKNRTPQLDLEELEEDRAEYLQENFDKAMEDFKFIESARKNISDRELAAQLARMQRVAKKLLANLEKNPERIPLAYKFIDYYQDRAVKIVKQYQELEETELSTDRVRDLKNRMKTTLAALDDAYADQFEHVLNDQIISADAELKVMQQQLDAEGIKHKTVEVGAVDEYGNVRIDTDLLNQPLGGVEIKNLPVGTIPSVRSPRRNRRARYDDEDLPTFPENERPQIIQKKLVQSALAIFLGSLGAHKFYQGKTLQGVLYLLFFWTTLPTWISFIEGVRYLFMPVEDFYEQYIKDDKKRH